MPDGSWDEQWQKSEIPYGDPYFPGEQPMPRVSSPKEYKKQKKQYQAQVKMQKRMHRKAVQARLRNVLFTVLIVVAVAAVIIYKLVNGVQMIGPDIDQLPEIRRH